MNRPADGRLRGEASPRAPPVAPHAAGALAPRSAPDEASAPRAALPEALVPRPALSGALAPRVTLPAVVAVPPQRTVVVTVPARTGILANIGVLPPPCTREQAAVTSVTAFRPFPGPQPVLPHPEEGSGTGVAKTFVPITSGQSPSPPNRDPGMGEVRPAASGGLDSAGDGGFPLVGIARSVEDATLPSRGRECDVQRRLGPPVTGRRRPSCWHTCGILR